MTLLRRLLPDGLAGRFALLLAMALIAANLAALALFSAERTRLDNAAMMDREIERIVSLVPVIEAADPARRRALAHDASTRNSRLSIDQVPLAGEARFAPAPALADALADALPGRMLLAGTAQRSDDDDDHGKGMVLAVSIALATPQAAPAQWLNMASRGDRRKPPGVDESAFLMVLALSLLCVLGVGLVFVRLLTRPLRALAAAAQAAGQGDRMARVPETGAREMREAAAAFNDMQTRIARFDAERMRTLAAVGHDLRTPITSLRIRAELLDEAEAEPMIRTLDEMTVMADGLVAYAKGAGDAEPMQSVELAPLLARLADGRGATLAPMGTPRITGRPVALGRALGNLLDNAQRYGGGARIGVKTGQGQAIITVEDTGPGIPAADLDAMFEPFVRGEQSRNSETGGAGLGLSIARNIIIEHGGSVMLENRKEGGLRATVTLPLAKG